MVSGMGHDGWLVNFLELVSCPVYSLHMAHARQEVMHARANVRRIIVIAERVWHGGMKDSYTSHPMIFTIPRDKSRNANRYRRRWGKTHVAMQVGDISTCRGDITRLHGQQFDDGFLPESTFQCRDVFGEQ